MISNTPRNSTRQERGGDDNLIRWLRGAVFPDGRCKVWNFIHCCAADIWPIVTKLYVSRRVGLGPPLLGGLSRAERHTCRDRGRLIPAMNSS